MFAGIEGMAIGTYTQGGVLACRAGGEGMPTAGTGEGDFRVFGMNVFFHSGLFVISGYRYGLGRLIGTVQLSVIHAGKEITVIFGRFDLVQQKSHGILRTHGEKDTPQNPQFT